MVKIEKDIQINSSNNLSSSTIINILNFETLNFNYLIIYNAFYTYSSSIYLSL
jgi:hypothetical protein